jgi:hypothetical protein
MRCASRLSTGGTVTLSPGSGRSQQRPLAVYADFASQRPSSDSKNENMVEPYLQDGPCGLSQGFTSRNDASSRGMVDLVSCPFDANFYAGEDVIREAHIFIVEY